MPRKGIATVTHLRGTQDFSIYGTRKVHDKLDVAKVSLLIVRTCVSIVGIHLQESLANQSAQNGLLIDDPYIYLTTLESHLTSIFVCVKNAGCTIVDAHIFDMLALV